MSIVSGTMQARAATKAAKTQAAAARDASATQYRAAELSAEVTREGMAQQERLTAPWREAGDWALGKLENKIGYGPGGFEESPGYKFRLSEGEKAINRFASSKGGLLSGATGKALAAYGQDYATGDYDKFLSRYYDSLTPYQSLAGLGQTSATSTAGMIGQGYSGLANIEQNKGAATAAGYLGAGQAQASNYLSQGKIWSNSTNQGLQAYSAWNAGQTPSYYTASDLGYGVAGAGGTTYGYGGLSEAQTAGALF